MIEINVNTFTTNVKVNCDKKWKSEILSKPKLRTYITFKDDHSVEHYVKYYNSGRKCSLLTQFRIYILPLAI